MKQSNGKTYWRSLSELQETEEFRDFLHREFPTAASEFPEGVSRRRWMELMGASLALGGLAGCRWQKEKIVPLAVRPENRVPGATEKFATSIEVAGMPRHLLMTCVDGRPIKVEGNPDHPDSKGATDTFAQASILDLYDPDRSDTIRESQPRQTFTRTWDEFDAAMDARLTQLAKKRGDGLAILLEPSDSCARKAILKRIRNRFPRIRFYEYAPLTNDETAATECVFGRKCRTSLRLEKAKRIACFDADLLGLHPTAIRNAGGFAVGRGPDESMSRLYSVESQFSLTGAAADHRLPIRSCQIPELLGHVEALVSAKLGLQPIAAASTRLDEKTARFAMALADDLVEHRGESLVVVGPTQPAPVRELALILNDRLGNTGNALELLPLSDDLAVQPIESFVAAAKKRQIDTLVIIGGNPVYDAPGELSLGDALKSIPATVRLGLYDDETSAACTWHAPLAHDFESWSDVRGWDGTISVTQPLIAPLLEGRSLIEVLAKIAGDSREPQQIVRESIGQAIGTRLSTTRWQKLVHDGLLVGAHARPLEAKATTSYRFVPPKTNGELEVVFTASSSTLDGRFANNGWMQETPDFLTKLTWDNAALVSPATAEDLGLQHGKFARIEVSGSSVEVPVYVMPGQARGSIGLAMGYGRTRAGVVGGNAEEGVASVGVDVNPIRPCWNPLVATDVKVTPVNREYEFATTQDHHAIDKVGMEEIGRRVDDLIRESPLDHFLKHPDFVDHHAHHPEVEPLWKEPSYDGHAWGMAIDLNKCIGCNACTVACQAENNVPIVGKDQVALGREMDWLRIDRYFTGDLENPEVAHQPVACHHCENAPCEQVCPVAATVHSDEGLNDMVYNRCIGTRYCANNCPYKVRRFNFFDYNQELEDANRQLAVLSVNPEVTVRSRGVMEKCTYCVQRIQKVKIDARTGRRTIEDGEIKTACQQACPSQAIEFGDLNDPDSAVAKAHASNRSYGMLSELNVKPRTQYLARIRNLNPNLMGHPAHDEHDAAHDKYGPNAHQELEHVNG